MSQFLAAYNPGVDKPINADLQYAFWCILYIFNTATIYENTNGYTFGDIQTAIWTLLYAQITPSSYPYPGSLYTYSDGALYTDPTAPYVAANAYAIINDAILHTQNTNATNYTNLINPWSND